MSEYLKRKMRYSPTILLLLAFNVAFVSAAGWNFVQNGTSGVLALEVMIISPTLAIFFDRASNDPLTTPNGLPAWGALWNLEKNIATPLSLISDAFCGSGGFLSNGTMTSLAGDIPNSTAAIDGRMGLRLFAPCEDSDGIGCTFFEDPATLHLEETRWYPSSLRIFDGSLMVVGGIHDKTPFYNIDPVNNFEFFPAKDGGIPRPSAFLERSLPANLFPRIFALPDGTVLMIANNQTIIYDVEKHTETILPDIPNGVRVTSPFDGSATLLPLSPPDFIPEVLVCGGSNVSDLIQPANLSSQDPASTQCSRMTITPEGIKKGWEVEQMLEGRMMPEMLLVPNGDILIINGGQTGYAAFASIRDPVGNQSNADHPAFTPSIYTPDAPLGRRISNKDLPTTSIARLYHSTATLTPQGNFLIAGSNPNARVVNGTKFDTEFRVEYLNPPYMSVQRPTLSDVPTKIGFNQRFRVGVSIPENLNVSSRSIKVALMDLGFSSHAFHSSSRLVFMEAQLMSDRKSLLIQSPPNNRVYPPGPAFIFLTVDDVTSTGTQVMVGTGASPPVPDQGIRL